MYIRLAYAESTPYARVTYVHTIIVCIRPETGCHTIYVFLVKLLGVGLPAMSARHAAAHARLALHRLTPAKWNTHFRFVMRALPFDKRRAEARMTVRTPMLCYICGSGCDSAAHILVCPVVKAARHLISERVRIVLSKDPMETLLAQAPGGDPLLTMVIVTLNWAVWHLRTTFFSTLRETPGERASAERIANCTLMNLRLEGDRTPTTVQRLVALATQPPDSVAVAFTDGSEKDGQCGAGYTVQAPGLEREDYSHHLGEGGTNNDAEMAALQGALRRLLVLHREGRFKRAILFSDSACCLGYLLLGWRCPIQNLGLARETRRLYHLALKRFDLRLYWIRGHSGIPGNERADELARKGMEGATSGSGIDDGAVSAATRGRGPCQLHFA